MNKNVEVFFERVAQSVAQFDTNNSKQIGNIGLNILFLINQLQ